MEQKDFVADPAKGSRHNRGCAVDLSLFDLKSGQAIEMVSGYDEFSHRAYPGYPGERRCSGGIVSCSERRWRQRGSECSRWNGGTLISGIGGAIESGPSHSKRSNNGHSGGS